jgi:hypothetical protein
MKLRAGASVRRQALASSQFSNVLSLILKGGLPAITSTMGAVDGGLVMMCP